MVDNRTPYAAERTSIIDGRGAVLWVVVVKATYDVAADGSTTLAAEQVGPVLAPVHHGDPARSSLLYETDLVPPKPLTDVLVCGFAHAPGGRPSAEFTVGLEIAGGKATVTRAAEGRQQTVELTLPAVVSGQRDLAEEKYPKLKEILKAGKKPIADFAYAWTDGGYTVTALEPPPEPVAGKIVGEGPDAVPELFNLLQNEAKKLSF